MGRIHAAGMAADQRFRHRLELQAKTASRAGAACVKSSFFHSKTKAVQTYCTLVDQGTCALKQLLFPLPFAYHADALGASWARCNTAC